MQYIFESVVLWNSFLNDISMTENSLTQNVLEHWAAFCLRFKKYFLNSQVTFPHVIWVPAEVFTLSNLNYTTQTIVPIIIIIIHLYLLFWTKQTNQSRFILPIYNCIYLSFIAGLVALFMVLFFANNHESNNVCYMNEWKHVLISSVTKTIL